MRQAYLGGVWFKAAHGACDMLTAVIVLAAPTLLPAGALWAAGAAGDILGGPGSFVAAALRGVGADLLSWPGWLLGAFLLVHGTVKLGSAYCLLRRFARGYPWALGALCALLVYQLIDAILTGSVLMAVYVVLDVVVILLVVVEYRELRRRVAAPPAVEAGGAIDEDPSACANGLAIAAHGGTSPPRLPADRMRACSPDEPTPRSPHRSTAQDGAHAVV